MRLTLPLAAFALLATFAAPLAAQTIPPSSSSVQGTEQHQKRPKRTYMSLAKRFETANTSHDGHLTRDQASSSPLMHVVSKNFDAIDKDHKGFVTQDDIHGWYRARREARKQAKEATEAKS